MGILPADLNLMLEEEVAVDSPVSEQLLSKIGANINYLAGVIGNREEFLTAGSTPWTIPENVTRVRLFGCGGGGGGASGRTEGRGGGGGNGCIPYFIDIDVTPLASATIVVGAGGAGGPTSTPSTNGTAGGNTTFTVSGRTITFSGGQGGTHTNNASPNALANTLVKPALSDWFTQGGGIGTISFSVQEAGESSRYAAGGAIGSGQSGGNGGGAGYGAGGKGGDFLVDNAQAGQGFGAGGGGGSGVGGTNGIKGGNGFRGFLIIFY